MTSKTTPAQIGPAIRPKLMKELLDPVAAPWPTVARLEVSEITDVRSSVLDRMNRLVAKRIVG